MFMYDKIGRIRNSNYNPQIKMAKTNDANMHYLFWFPNFSGNLDSGSKK